MAVTLKPIDSSNWRQAVKLKVASEQERFVASNAASLAQAAYSGEDWHPHAVYAGEKMVGFIMWLHTEHEERPVFFIARLMVVDGLQGQGYGRQALLAAFEVMRAHPSGATDVYISFLPDNDVSRHLYSKLGFTLVGKTDDGSEDLMLINLDDITPKDDEQ